MANSKKVNKNKTINTIKVGDNDFPETVIDIETAIIEHKGNQVVTRSNGGTKKTLFGEDGKIIKEIFIPDSAINKSYLLKKPPLEDTLIPEEFKSIPKHRQMERNEIDSKIKEVSKKHKIKTSTGREISKKEEEQEPNETEWLSRLGKTLGDPEALNKLSDHFDSIAANRGEWVQEMWEKQKETMSDTDGLIQEESEKLEFLLKQGSVINGLFVIKDYMDKLILLLDAVEKFLDIEISSSDDYELIRSPYGRAHMNISDAVMEIQKLINNVIEEKKRLKDVKVEV